VGLDQVLHVCVQLREPCWVVAGVAREHAHNEAALVHVASRIRLRPVRLQRRDEPRHQLVLRRLLLPHVVFCNVLPPRAKVLRLCCRRLGTAHRQPLRFLLLLVRVDLVPEVCECALSTKTVSIVHSLRPEPTSTGASQLHETPFCQFRWFGFG
jgi:hypothetical protein